MQRRRSVRDFLHPSTLDKPRKMEILKFALFTAFLFSQADDSVAEQLRGSEHRVSDWFTQLVSHFEPLPDDVSPLCVNHTMEYLRETRKNLTSWAARMSDASGKFPSGTLSGNIHSLGSFDQCIYARQPRGEYAGKYCLPTLRYVTTKQDGDEEENGNIPIEDFVDLITAHRRRLEPVDDWMEGTILFPLFSTTEWAFCVPSTCSLNDVRILAETAIERVTAGTGLKFSMILDESRCYEASRTRSYDIMDVIQLCIFVLLAVLILTSTFFIYFNIKIDKVASKVMNAFSVTQNWKRLTDLGVQPKNSITCLEGIRTVSTIWVVMTHQFLVISQTAYVNKLDTLKAHDNILYYLMWNSYMNVDTFFLVSGLLRSYKLLKEYKDGIFSTVSPSIQRYLRLTPTYLFVIIFYASVFDLMGTGPKWNYYVGRNRDACRSYWWQNLLYINNYVPHNNKCLLQSWYLAADMQFFLLAPLVVYPCWRWKSMGKIAMIVALVASIIFPMIYTFIYELPGTFVASVPNSKLNEYSRVLYMASHNRMSPYLIGLCLGGVLREFENIIIPKWLVLTAWSAALSVMIACVYGAFGITSVDYTYNLWESVAYGGLHRFAWALAVAWVVYACQIGYGGIINKFLSCNIFRVLGRLSYCVYLSHFIVLLYNVGLLQAPRQFHAYISVRNFLGDFVVIFVISCMLYMFVELPISALQSSFFRTRNKK